MIQPVDIGGGHGLRVQAQQVVERAVRMIHPEGQWRRVPAHNQQGRGQKAPAVPSRLRSCSKRVQKAKVEPGVSYHQGFESGLQHPRSPEHVADGDSIGGCSGTCPSHRTLPREISDTPPRIKGRKLAVCRPRISGSKVRDDCFGGSPPGHARLGRVAP